MQTKFMLDGSRVSVLKLNEDLLLDKLPARIYNVQFNALSGFYLDIVKDKLVVPSKVYGETIARADKCISTYRSRTASTGILLTGDKGTGKTLLMAVLANKIIDELDLPILLIKDAFAGSQFVTFIETIGECVLVFDEFGKMYSSSDRQNGDQDVPQKALLSLMDGTDKTKRMLILTENNEIDINDFMLNRPSRIYYHFRYKKLDESSILGYCKDHKVAKKIVRDIIDLARRSKIFSFDMLQSIVEEHLRFNCDIETVTTDLNIDTREDRGATIEILKVFERVTEVPREIFDTPFVSKPDSGYTYIKVKIDYKAANTDTPQPITMDCDSGNGKDIEDEQLYEEIYVRDTDLAYERDGQLVYETDNFVFVAKNVIPSRSNYFNLF